MSNHGPIVPMSELGRPRKDRELHTVSFFDGVSSATVEALSRRCRWHVVDEGDTLIAAGNILDRVFFVLSGEFRFSLYTRLGKVVSLRGAVQGAFIGEAALAEGVTIPYSIEAARLSTVASIGAKTFMEQMEEDRFLFRAVMRNVVQRQDLLTEQLVELTTLNVHARVQNELARLSRESTHSDGSATIHPIPKHSDLAKRIGTHREAVSRVMSHLQHIGVVLRGEGELLIPDIARLLDAHPKD